MESSSPEPESVDKCSINGDCSPLPNDLQLDINHVKNIDDISTPSELKFDQGIIIM